MLCVTLQCSSIIIDVLNSLVVFVFLFLILQLSFQQLQIVSEDNEQNNKNNKVLRHTSLEYKPYMGTLYILESINYYTYISCSEIFFNFKYHCL